MVITMLSSFVVTIILGQTLSFNDFGEFALLKQFILIGPTIAIFGLNYSYIKVFSNNPDSCKKTHLITMIIVSLITILFVLILKIIYNFELYKLLFIYFCIGFSAINMYQAAIYRLKNQFLIAQLFTGGWKVVLLILIGIFIFSEITIDIIVVYQILTVSLFIFSTFIIRYFFKNYNVNNRKTNLKNYLTMGLVFCLINSTGLISGGIDKLVIPIIYDREVLGIFTGVSFIFITSLSMIGSAIGYVIFPKISSGKEINMTKLSLTIICITFFAVIIFQFIGKELVNILFYGKFDNFIDKKLIFCFTLLGFFQIVHIILHFILSAIGGKKQLIYYWILSIISIGMFIILLYTLKPELSLIEKVLPSAILNLSLIILITRIVKIISMIFLLKFKVYKNI
jgi:O-antigen/teichoic acid export membrane protein